METCPTKHVGQWSLSLDLSSRQTVNTNGDGNEKYFFRGLRNDYSSIVRCVNAGNGRLDVLCPSFYRSRTPRLIPSVKYIFALTKRTNNLNPRKFNIQNLSSRWDVWNGIKIRFSCPTAQKRSLFSGMPLFNDTGQIPVWPFNRNLKFLSYIANVSWAKGLCFRRCIPITCATVSLYMCYRFAWV